MIDLPGDVGPNIIGQFGASKADHQIISGAFKKDSDTLGADGSQNSASQFSFDASRCSAIYREVATVQPDSVLALLCIKT